MTIHKINLNYPEQFESLGVEEIKEKLAENGLQCNAINLRFRGEFIKGEFGNPDRGISQKAVRLCKEAADVCKEYGSQQMIIWLGFDGFDYLFQIDYRRMVTEENPNRVPPWYRTVCRVVWEVG